MTTPVIGCLHGLDISKLKPNAMEVSVLEYYYWSNHVEVTLVEVVSYVLIVYVLMVAS